MRYNRPTFELVLGMRVDVSSYSDATARAIRWAEEGKSSYVCVANVHMTMEAYGCEEFASVVNGADLVVPDGIPLVWGLRALGVSEASQVRGADLVTSVVAAAERNGLPIALYGGTPDSLADFVRLLEERHPNLRVACAISPPFRPLTAGEDEEFTRRIRDSGARIVLVGIGCPRQERWMSAHKGKIPAVMLGVGAAFDFHTGRIRQAPRWMQRTGLEWVFRLAMDPKRLWRRYARHNPRFVALFLAQLAETKLGKGRRV